MTAQVVTALRRRMLRVFGAACAALNVNLLSTLRPDLDRWWLLAPAFLTAILALSLLGTSSPVIGKHVYRLALLGNLAGITLIVLDMRWLDDVVLAIIVALGGVAGGALCVTGMPGAIPATPTRVSVPAFASVAVGVIGILLVSAVAVDYGVKLLDLAVGACALLIVLLSLRNWLWPAK